MNNVTVEEAALALMKVAGVPEESMDNFAVWKAAKALDKAQHREGLIAVDFDVLDSVMTRALVALETADNT